MSVTPVDRLLCSKTGTQFVTMLHFLVADTVLLNCREEHLQKLTAQVRREDVKEVCVYI